MPFWGVLVGHLFLFFYVTTPLPALVVGFRLALYFLTLDSRVLVVARGVNTVGAYLILLYAFRISFI